MFQLLRYEGFFSQILGKLIYQFLGKLNCQNLRKQSYELQKLGELFDAEKGTLASEKNIDGQYDFVTASEEWKSHCSYDMDCEAIVYAVQASGSLGRSHYVNGKFIASNLCLVLTPKFNSECTVPHS